MLVSFELEYSVWFAEGKTKDIVNDIQSSNYLSTRSCKTYNRYKHFDILIINNKEILNSLEAVSSEHTSGKRWATFHVNNT